MIIGFFGKGGSGKTTTCFQFLQNVRDEYVETFAIDADHNMDLSYNLGVEHPEAYVGQPKTLSSGIRFMAAGPHTEEVFRGDVCSHYLFRPLKDQLRDRPRNHNELVVVDNTAGMDSVGAGIPALLDVAVVCVEPAIHSLKVGRQVADGLKRTQTQTVIVANKIQTPEQEQEIRRAFPEYTIVTVPLGHPGKAFHGLHTAVRNLI
ncbi:hypothetical protein M0Q28_01885 [Patescibacteria group bacterium]|jgi:CO dehydrogenase maturation factor|nr:hypothetical protein [Patescibacteria group bacterium]